MFFLFNILFKRFIDTNWNVKIIDENNEINTTIVVQPGTDKP